MEHREDTPCWQHAYVDYYLAIAMLTKYQNGAFSSHHRHITSVKPSWTNWINIGNNNNTPNEIPSEY